MRGARPRHCSNALPHEGHRAIHLMLRLRRGGRGRRNLAPSCSTPVSEGMVVNTNSPRVRAARRTALELLLSNHRADCAYAPPYGMPGQC
ncbi:MAG: hypothetical protein MZV70_22620 [Desulfobacterales bacterium]|nr:hypothetical protein [Desulfobacterales bacterium]